MSEVPLCSGDEGGAEESVEEVGARQQGTNGWKVVAVHDIMPPALVEEYLRQDVGHLQG